MKETESGGGDDRLSFTDEELYARVVDKDAEALELLYDKYERLVYSFAYRMVQDAQRAEDVVQDVFSKLWRDHAAFDATKGKFSSWLLTMTRNRCLDILRKVSKQQEVGLFEKDNDRPTDTMGEMPEQATEWKEKSERIREALSYLKEDQRKIVELFYFHGYSQDRISKDLDIPLGTVKGRIRLALQHLRKRLEPERGDLADGTIDV